MIEKVGWKAEPHPHPYKVSWINSTTLDVKQWCLVPIEFDVYKEKIWCDVVTMDVGQIILRQPWLYDNDITIHGRSNMCQFEHESKKIKLTPYRSIAKSLNLMHRISQKELIWYVRQNLIKNSRMVLHAWSYLLEKWLRRQIALFLWKSPPWLRSLMMSSPKTFRINYHRYMTSNTPSI